MKIFVRKFSLVKSNKSFLSLDDLQNARRNISPLFEIAQGASLASHRS
jgi:hypothetical protein